MNPLASSSSFPRKRESTKSFRHRWIPACAGMTASALVLFAAPTFGQPPEDEVATAPEPQAEPAPEPAAPKPEPSREGEDSPYDYQASEQISEDKSVSFPVDI